MAIIPTESPTTSKNTLSQWCVPSQSRLSTVVKMQKIHRTWQSKYKLWFLCCGSRGQKRQESWKMSGTLPFPLTPESTAFCAKSTHQSPSWKQFPMWWRAQIKRRSRISRFASKSRPFLSILWKKLNWDLRQRKHEFWALELNWERIKSHKNGGILHIFNLLLKRWLFLFCLLAVLNLQDQEYKKTANNKDSFILSKEVVSSNGCAKAQTFRNPWDISACPENVHLSLVDLKGVEIVFPSQRFDLERGLHNFTSWSYWILKTSDRLSKFHLIYVYTGARKQHHWMEIWSYLLLGDSILTVFCCCQTNKTYRWGPELGGEIAIFKIQETKDSHLFGGDGPAYAVTSSPSNSSPDIKSSPKYWGN